MEALIITVVCNLVGSIVGGGITCLIGARVQRKNREKLKLAIQEEVVAVREAIQTSRQIPNEPVETPASDDSYVQPIGFRNLNVY